MNKLSFSWKIFFVALLARLIPVLLTRSLGIGLDDMFQYDMLARSLASGNGFRWYAFDDLQHLSPYVDFDLSAIPYDPARGVPTSFRAPLYPAFLALIYFFTGSGAERFFVARLAQVVLGAALAPLTCQIARRIFPQHQPASVISAWIVALYPLLLIYPIGLATENLFFTLLLLSFLYLLKVVEQPVSRNFLLSGFFLGLTILTRSVIIPFLGLAILWLWFVLRQKRGAVLVALAALALILPWVARNSLLHGKLTAVESSMGYNLYVGYHPESDGSFTFGVSLDLLSILDDAERDQIGKHAAWEFMRAQPERFIPLLINRVGYFFGLEKRALMYFYSNNLLGELPTSILLAAAGILLLPFVLVSLSAVLGLALGGFNQRIFLAWVLMAVYMLPHFLILSEDRFHLALVPFFAIFAARAWTGGLREIPMRWRASRAGKVVLSIAILSICLLCLNWGLELMRDADKIAALLAPGGNQTYFPY
ncbi:MAG: hypothetical protein Kow002_14450 [Anaerolineales bacterium]